MGSIVFLSNLTCFSSDKSGMENLAIGHLQNFMTLLLQAAEAVIAATLAAAVQGRSGGGGGGGGGVRRGPMCEATFPEGSTSREQFEGHVVEHFSYEESATLNNFDTMPDAFWPAALQDQSLL